MHIYSKNMGKVHLNPLFMYAFPPELISNTVTDFTKHYNFPVVAIGMGGGVFEHQIRNAGLKDFQPLYYGVDPDPSSWDAQRNGVGTPQKVAMNAHYSTVSELILHEPQLVANCVVWVFWPDEPQEDDRRCYDCDFYRNLQPRGILYATVRMLDTNAGWSGSNTLVKRLDARTCPYIKVLSYELDPLDYRNYRLEWYHRRWQSADVMPEKKPVVYVTPSIPSGCEYFQMDLYTMCVQLALMIAPFLPGEEGEPMLMETELRASFNSHQTDNQSLTGSPVRRQLIQAVHHAARAIRSKFPSAPADIGDHLDYAFGHFIDLTFTVPMPCRDMLMCALIISKEITGEFPKTSPQAVVMPSSITGT